MFMFQCSSTSELCLFVFFLLIRRPPRSTRTDTLFPYTPLFRTLSFYLGYGSIIAGNKWKLIKAGSGSPQMKLKEDALYNLLKGPSENNNLKEQYPEIDRKSTRLNSSH